MNTPRLEHQTFTVTELVDDYRNGRIVIPEFQRDFAWKANKAPALVDSLYQGFPISSFLLWQSTEETRARKSNPRPQKVAVMNWLVDGQQRIITLSRTISGDEDIVVVFHPDRQEFRLENAATKHDPNWYHVSELWDDNSYRKIRSDLSSRPNATKCEERFDAVRRILDYRIPVVRMVDHSFDNAVKVFERINTYGVKLDRSDIESAQISARHIGFIVDNVLPFVKKVHGQGFTRINVMHLFRICAFIATPDARTHTPLHQMTRSEVLAAWKKTVKATEKAMALIRSELGLLNMGILWSGTLLVPVIAICSKMSPSELKPKELVGWISLAALCHRYSGSSDTALIEDLSACRQSDPIAGLLANLKKGKKRSLKAKAEDFSGALADRGGLFALYVACKKRGIKDFYGGSQVLLQGNVNYHHILPRSQFPENERHIADNIANMAFITGPVNKSISNTGPEVYLAAIKPDILKSQCVPMDSALWKTAKSKQFWKARRAVVAEAFNEHIECGHVI